MKGRIDIIEKTKVAKLSQRDRSFLLRILRHRRIFLVFSYIGIAVAVFLLTVYIVFFDSMNGTRIALIIMILLKARANLKLYKAANILRKLSAGAIIKHREYTDMQLEFEVK
jgi:ABC-type lipoprotein release transport system permease subunit